MKATDDWKTVLRHAWSVRFLLLAFVFTALETVLPFVDVTWLPFELPVWLLPVATALSTGAAFVARLVAQKQFQDPK